MSSVGVQTSLTTLTHALNASSDCFEWDVFPFYVSGVDVAELKSVEGGYVYRSFFPTHPRYARLG